MSYRLRGVDAVAQWIQSEGDTPLRDRALDWLTELARDPGSQPSFRPPEVAPATILFLPKVDHADPEVVVTAVVDDEARLITVLDIQTLHESQSTR